MNPQTRYPYMMEKIAVSERMTIYLGSTGEVPFAIDDGFNLTAFTTNEINALAAHTPVVQSLMTSAKDALDFIKYIVNSPGRNSEYYHGRSRIIEALHAALQAVEDVKE